MKVHKSLAKIGTTKRTPPASHWRAFSQLLEAALPTRVEKMIGDVVLLPLMLEGKLELWTIPIKLYAVLSIGLAVVTSQRAQQSLLDYWKVRITSSKPARNAALSQAQAVI